MDIFGPVALFLAVFINTAAPGPCVVVVFGRSARVGPGSGIRVAAGVVIGITVMLGAALLMTVGAMAISEGLYAAMKWGGVVILLALASKIIRDSGHPHEAETLDAGRGHSGVLTGIMLGISSPYNLVFFLGLLPQYLPAGDLSAQTALATGASGVAGASAAMAVVCMLGSGSGKLCTGCAVWFERLAAISLVFFAGMTVASTM